MDVVPPSKKSGSDPDVVETSDLADVIYPSNALE